MFGFDIVSWLIDASHINEYILILKQHKALLLTLNTSFKVVFSSLGHLARQYHLIQSTDRIPVLFFYIFFFLNVRIQTLITYPNTHHKADLF